jgi:glycosyltransferase involved in cell wall biosynthesis
VRVLALSPIPIEGAGCRFRIAQFVPYLREHGFDVTISPFYSREYFDIVYRRGHFVQKAAGVVPLLWKRLRALGEIGNYDLVFLYREAIPAGPPMIERAIAKRGIPIVYDFDDAIFLPNVSEANQRVSFLKKPERIAEVLRLCTKVIAGNEFLATYARRHSGDVTVIPTAVDTDYFKPAPPRPAGRGRLTVGWIGSPTTFQYLKGFAPVLREVAAAHPFTLRVSGAGERVDFPGLQVETPAWSLAGEVALFNTLDIGVYPLKDDDWSRGKCGFKAIQCMACGVPVVAQAVGVNREIIVDGENGFLASSPAEWAQKLGRLLSDAPLRERFARAGRKTIEERYSVRAVAPRLEAVLREAWQRSGAPSAGAGAVAGEATRGAGRGVEFRSASPAAVSPCPPPAGGRLDGAKK